MTLLKKRTPGLLGMLALGLGCVASSVAHAAPFISEIMSNPAGSETTTEWVEIYNPDGTALDLSGFKLRARQTSGTMSSNTFVLPAGSNLPSLGFLVLGSTATLGGQASCNVAAVTYASGITLYNSSSPAVELLDPTDTVVDSVLYLSAGFPTSTDGRSMGVIDLTLGNDTPGNWRNGDCSYSATPQYGTPGATNATCADMPGTPVCLPVPDAGPLPPDAGPMDLDAGPTADAAVPVDMGVFISEIFFDAPSTSDTNLEWVELYNPTAQDVMLNGFKLRTAVDRVFVLGANAVVPAQGYLLVSQTEDLGGTLSCAISAITYGSALSLGNSSGAYIELVDPSDVILDHVGYVAAGFPSPAAGSSLEVADVALGNNAGSLWTAGDCIYGGKVYTTIGFANSHGTPGLPHQSCAATPDAGVITMCLPTPDGGLLDGGAADAAPRVDAAGLLEPLDASFGSNSAPLVTVTSPSSATTGPMVTVTWDVTDPDGDVVSVSVLKAAVGSVESGDEVLSGLTASGTATWDTTDVSPGTYVVLVRADDGHGHVVTQAASGQVEVGRGSAPISVESPKGGESAGDQFVIRVKTTSADGLISIFFDTDNAGLDGTAIAGALRARGGVVEVNWNVQSVPAGSYFVYAVLEGAGTTASAYSAGAVTVQRPRRCGCSTTQQPGSSPAGLLVAAVGLWAVRRAKTLRAARPEGGIL